MIADQSRQRLLSIAEVAELLHLSERTVKRRIKDGEIAAHKLGHQWRIARADVENYLRTRRWGGDRNVL